MKNKVIRQSLKDRGLHLWELAELLNVSEATVTRMMRHELPEEEQKRILDLIHGGNKNAEL